MNTDEMSSKKDDLVQRFGVSATISDDPDERKTVENSTLLSVNGGAVAGNSTKPRFRRHSVSSYIPVSKQTKSPENDNVEAPRSSNPTALLNRRRKISLPSSPIYDGSGETPSSEDTTSNANAFVGLRRRRKYSLPSTSKKNGPDQFFEGARMQIGKSEVNLDTCVPVFAKEAMKNRKSENITPLTRTEFNGWMFDIMDANIAGCQGCLSRQRRISLPVLKVDGPGSDGAVSNCNAVTEDPDSSHLAAMPRVKSGLLAHQRDKLSTWTPRN